MDSLEFYCRDLVEQSPTSGTFLFNRSDHLHLQSKKGWKVYGLFHQNTKEVVATLFINIKGKRAYSPFRAPFGSLQLSAKVPQKKVDELFSKTVKDLALRGIKFLQIKNYPDLYDPPTAHKLQNTLSSLGFSSVEEISSIISADHRVFEKHIAIAQRQKLRKSEKRFVFSHVDSKGLKRIYNFIHDCRKEKNQPLSMPYSQVRRTVNRFPDHFLLFQVGHEELIASAAIVIKIDDKILYTFYYSHHTRFNKISPVVHLISGIYQYAREHQFKLIDLGTSMVNGGINKPLVQFKKSIGGVSSSKFIFEKMIS